jgi:PAS domain S-box-containing protein
MTETISEVMQDLDWGIIQYLEFSVAVLTLLGVVIPLTWKYIIKPFIKLYKSHFILMNSVDEIKKELTPNGGSSIKDVINRIEERQIMIDKRSKAIFYNYEAAIFEVDRNGNILWANQSFHKVMGTKNLKGLDWVSIIDEPKREDFLKELESCSKRIRELRFETKSTEGKEIKFSGFPYRDNDRNFGFLIYLEGVKKDGI